MSSSQKKYLRIFLKFQPGQTHSLLQGIFGYCKALPKLFLLGWGIDMTSRGERLLARSIATMLRRICCDGLVMLRRQMEWHFFFTYLSLLQSSSFEGSSSTSGVDEEVSQ